MIKLLRRQEGLGDTVALLTEMTGIAYTVKKVAKAIGKDCGCDKRKDELNKKYNYGREK
jgi:hypothetical protein